MRKDVRYSERDGETRGRKGFTESTYVTAGKEAAELSGERGSRLRERQTPKPCAGLVCACVTTARAANVAGTEQAEERCRGQSHR